MRAPYEARNPERVPGPPAAFRDRPMGQTLLGLPRQVAEDQPVELLVVTRGDEGVRGLLV